jgi:5-methylcytosine-specific restriction endonuclease McrA
MPIKKENRALPGQNRTLNAAARAARQERGVPIPCAHCKIPFRPHLIAGAKFCTPACARASYCAARRALIKPSKPCVHCGNSFKPEKSAKAAYCSGVCKNASRAARVKSSPSQMELRRAVARRHAKGEKYRFAQANFKARRRAAEHDGDLTHSEWLDVCQRYKNRCAYCGEPKKLTVDHITPLSKGGRHTARNVAPACKSCNSAKRDRDWSGRLQCP